MESADSNKQYSFTLKRINLLEKSLSFNGPISNIDEFSFEISLQIASNLDLKESHHIMRVTINSKKDVQKLGSISLGCTFFIPDYLEIKTSHPDTASLPNELIYLLNTVIIGTMRGVMYSEFRGTILNNAYLPVLDPRNFEQVTGK